MMHYDLFARTPGASPMFVARYPAPGRAADELARQARRGMTVELRPVDAGAPLPDGAVTYADLRHALAHLHLTVLDATEYVQDALESEDGPLESKWLDPLTMSAGYAWDVLNRSGGVLDWDALEDVPWEAIADRRSQGVVL